MVLFAYVRNFLYFCTPKMDIRLYWVCSKQTKMKNEEIHTIYFLGIGGIGMSALARYFAAQGYRVMGYDRTPSPLTHALKVEGIEVQYEDATHWVEQLDKTHTLVVRTPAVPTQTKLYRYLQEQGFQILKRAEVLGRVTKEKKALCVAGTHGKTTTSTILAHILHHSHVGTSAFLGGIANNYGTNVLIDTKSDYVVVEADEFDRSFHHLSPYMSVITSIDPDHLDIYGTEDAYRESFMHYAGLVEKALVVKEGVELSSGGVELSSSGVEWYAYGVDTAQHDSAKPHFYADNVRVENGELHFDFHTLVSVVRDIRLGVPARVNVENSVAAMAIAHLVGATDEELRQGVESFTGVYRRFNVHVNTSNVAYIDDYAHHPQELAASIESVRCLYPDRHMIGVFQPHLFTRTRDFLNEFASVLSTLDEVVLLPIYPAREEPIEGVTSERLKEEISRLKTEDNSVRVVEKEELCGVLSEQCKRLNAAGKACVVMTLGAGDIDRLVMNVKEELTR